MAQSKYNTIVRASTTHYHDNGQIVGQVEWADGAITTGNPANPHIDALFKRCRRERIEITHHEA